MSSHAEVPASVHAPSACCPLPRKGNPQGALTIATSVNGQNGFAARSAQLPTLASAALSAAGEDWCGGVATVFMLRRGRVGASQAAHEG